MRQDRAEKEEAYLPWYDVLLEQSLSEIVHRYLDNVRRDTVTVPFAMPINFWKC